MKTRISRQIIKPKTTTTNTTVATATTNQNNLTVISSDIIERKIENATEGLSLNCFNFLHNRILLANKQNVLTICDYISSLMSEINPSDGYRKNTIILLCIFSIFFKNTKLFKEVTREDILSFLDSFRKIETVDPLHKWIGTYNLYRMQLMCFFKWLYYPDIEQNKIPKPPIIENISQLKRKEKSIYKPTDLWIDEDDSLFLKYCPNPRDRCYRAMSRDSGSKATRTFEAEDKGCCVQTYT